MSVATLKKLDERKQQADVARKQLDESLEKYIEARFAHHDALRTHNEKG